MLNSKNSHIDKIKSKKISYLWVFLIYSIPLGFVIGTFPFQDKIVLNNPYPYSASFSGTTMQFKMGFSKIPEIIPSYSKPPVLSAIGIPRDLFTYQTCFYHNSYFEINKNKINSDAVSLDVRVKNGLQTIHLLPNKHICLPDDNNNYTEIYIGNAITDLNKAPEIIKQNKLPIKGESDVLIIEEPVNNKIFMFIISLFSFSAIWWAAIITWKNVHSYIHIK